MPPHNLQEVEVKKARILESIKGLIGVKPRFLFPQPSSGHPIPPAPLDAKVWCMHTFIHDLLSQLSCAQM